MKRKQNNHFCHSTSVSLDYFRMQGPRVGIFAGARPLQIHRKQAFNCATHTHVCALGTILLLATARTHCCLYPSRHSVSRSVSRCAGLPSSAAPSSDCVDLLCMQFSFCHFRCLSVSLRYTLFCARYQTRNLCITRQWKCVAGLLVAVLPFVSSSDPLRLNQTI